MIFTSSLPPFDCLAILVLQPESGRLLYALSSVQWGPMRDAHENRDGYLKFKPLLWLRSRQQNNVVCVGFDSLVD